MSNARKEDSRTGLSRRGLLHAGTAGTSLLLLSPFISRVAAQEARHAADLRLFMRVSAALTMKDTLSDTIGERIFRALGGDNSAFVESLNRLDGSMKSVEQWSTKDKAAAHEIISAWYLGRTGSDPGAEVIAYEKALMFDPVSDILVPRSYCYRQPGYWSANPNKPV